jgi:hypothetical protein
VAVMTQQPGIAIIAGMPRGDIFAKTDADCSLDRSGDRGNEGALTCSGSGATRGLGEAGSVATTVGLAPETINEVFAWSSLHVLLSWLWPGILVAATVLWLTEPMYAGAAGLLRALIVAGVAMPSLLLRLAFLVGLGQRLAGTGGLDDIGYVVLALAVLLASLALVGGLLAGLVLYLASRALDPDRARSAGRAYLTAVFALLAWGGVTILVIYFVPIRDPYADHLWAMAHAPDAMAYLRERPGMLLGALVSFALLQSPGLWIAALIVAQRLGRKPRDPAVLLKACAATTGAVIVVLPIVASLTWMVLQEER